jgi:hypothetical protein
VVGTFNDVPHDEHADEEQHVHNVMRGDDTDRQISVVVDAPRKRAVADILGEHIVQRYKVSSVHVDRVMGELVKLEITIQ